jgi:hypothetical protein
MPFEIKTLPDGSLLPDKGKEFLLLSIEGAHLTNEPTEFQPNLVCILHNPDAEIAYFCYSEGEMLFYINDTRQKRWLIIPDADKLAK